MRAADSDRDAVADRLRTAHAEGRLTVEEFHERLDAAFAARTLGDLAGLTADLPAGPHRRRVARTGDEAELAPLERQPHGSLRAAWGTWATGSLVTTGVWFASGLSDQDWGSYWPAWVVAPWGALLLARTVFGGRS
jgi:hypothetical protein